MKRLVQRFQLLNYVSGQRRAVRRTSLDFPFRLLSTHTIEGERVGTNQLRKKTNNNNNNNNYVKGETSFSLSKQMSHFISKRDVEGAYALLKKEYLTPSAASLSSPSPPSSSMLSSVLHLCYEQRRWEWFNIIVEKIVQKPFRFHVASLSSSGREERIKEGDTKNNKKKKKKEDEEENLFSIILRFYTLQDNFKAAHRLFFYMHQHHQTLKRRNVSVFLQYTCQKYLSETHASLIPPEEKAAVKRSILFCFEYAVKHQMKLSISDVSFFGRCCADPAKGKEWRSEAHFLYFLRYLQFCFTELDCRECIPVAAPTAAVGMEGEEKEENRKDSSSMLDGVLLPWAASLGWSGRIVSIELPSSPSPSFLSPSLCPCCQTEITSFPFQQFHKTLLLKELTEKVIPGVLHRRPSGGSGGGAASGSKERSPHQPHKQRIATTKLQNFSHFIEQHKDRIDLIIDAANVGYYGLSSWYSIAKEKQLRYYLNQMNDVDHPQRHDHHHHHHKNKLWWCKDKKEEQYWRKLKIDFDRYQKYCKEEHGQEGEMSPMNNLYLREIDFNAQRKASPHPSPNNNNNNNSNNTHTALLFKEEEEEGDSSKSGRLLSPPPRRLAVDVKLDFSLIHQVLLSAIHTHGFRHPLIVLQERHLAHFFDTSSSSASPSSVWTEEERGMVRYWRQHQYCYCVPSGINDDLCWLQAALTLSRTQEEEEEEKRMATSKSDSVRKKELYVFTNDILRDHHFQLLSPFYFTHWVHRHCIRFTSQYIPPNTTTNTTTTTDMDNDGVKGRTVVEWRIPPPSVRCIQEQRKHRRWHLPLILPEKDGERGTSWLCLCAIG